jgi:hypothetical protein
MRRALAATLARGLTSCGPHQVACSHRAFASSSASSPAPAIHFTPTPAASALDAILEDALREAAAAGTFKREREIQGPQGPAIS